MLLLSGPALSEVPEDEKSEDPITNNLDLMKAVACSSNAQNLKLGILPRRLQAFETCKGIARNVAEVMVAPMQPTWRSKAGAVVGVRLFDILTSIVVRIRSSALGKSPALD